MKKFLTLLLIIGLLGFGGYRPENTSEICDYASANVNVEQKVCLGGQTVGIAIYTDGLLVSEVSYIETENGKVSPCLDAGIKAGDYLVSANGKELESSADIDRTVEKGEKINFTVKRDGQEFNCEVQPVKCENGYKLGLWLKDGTAGLGTVTFVEPESGLYMALGHSVCESTRKIPLSIKKGRITECTVTGVEKGTKVKAGELKGTFGINAKILGTVEENSDFGLAGIANGKMSTGTEIEFGKKEEITLGEAFIYSDFEGDGVKEYRIEITKINYQTEPKEKSMCIKVTDENLINLTGGIVQGMSGSPIVQKGKLIGAVTHVMLSDSTKGYGIFIENMLSAVG